MPRRAYSYARISGSRQRKGDGLRRQQGQSISGDASTPEIICGKKGWVLDEETYCDSGRSAYKGRNLTPTAALTRFLKDIENGIVASGSILLVENLDRLSRAKVRQAYNLFNSILMAGVDIYTWQNDRLYSSKDDDPMSLFEPLWLAVLNHQESEKKAIRCTQRWSEDRKHARLSHRPHRAVPPFWLRRAGDGYDLVPGQVEVILHLHRLCQSGLGIHSICVALEGQGVRCPGNSGRWNSKQVHEWLKTRTTLGEYQPCRVGADGKRHADGEPIAGYYPAVMTEDFWAATQAAIRGRKRARGRPPKHGVNVLAGLAYQSGTEERLTIRCGGCGPESDRQTKRMLGVRGTRGCHVDYEEVLRAVLDMVVQLQVSDVADPAPEAKAREAEIARLAARVTALADREASLKQRLADPEQDVDVIVPVLNDVVLERKRTAAERDRLKLETGSDRSTALGSCRTLAELRASKSGDELVELDRRIQTVIGRILDRVEVDVRPISPRKQWVRVSVRLVSGQVRAVVLAPGAWQGAPPLDWLPPTSGE